MSKDMLALGYCQKAGELLIAAGFKLHNVSMKSEACYYKHPAHIGLIRIATHGRQKNKFHHTPVIAKVTYSSKSPPRAWESAQNHLFAAVGRYFLLPHEGAR